VNYLVSNNINTLIIGKNKEWKQNAKIGKRNNQNFIQIPHTRFIEMLEYKCKLEGITVIVTEESYTSKCSFMDNEPIKKHTNYVGKRVKRGLFQTKENKLINSDLNGSLNILKKVVGEFQYPIEVCSTPLVLTIK
jgi:IS605 OrfB family transposase